MALAEALYRSEGRLLVEQFLVCGADALPDIGQLKACLEEYDGFKRRLDTVVAPLLEHLELDWRAPDLEERLAGALASRLGGE
jgi:hypothetical protein